MRIIRHIDRLMEIRNFVIDNYIATFSSFHLASQKKQLNHYRFKSYMLILLVITTNNNTCYDS